MHLEGLEFTSDRYVRISHTSAQKLPYPHTHTCSGVLVIIESVRVLKIRVTKKNVFLHTIDVDWLPQIPSCYS